MKINPLYKLLIGSYWLSLFAEGIILPIYAVFVQNIGGDILDASWAMATFLVTQGIFTILVHRFSRTAKNRIAVMIIGWVIWVLGISLYLVISNVLMLFVTQILTALWNAIADPIFDAELAEHTDKNNKLFEWWLFEWMQDIVNGIAAIIGWLLAAIYGFQALIIMMIVTATISLFLILYYINKVKKYKLLNL